MTPARLVLIAAVSRRSDPLYFAGQTLIAIGVTRVLIVR